MLRSISRAANAFDNYFDNLTFNLKKVLNLFKPIHIMPYLGYGSSGNVFIKGRVLEKRTISKAGESNSIWQNLKNTYKRIDSNEIAKVEIQVRFQDQLYTIFSDEEGYFESNIKPSQPLPDIFWQDLEITIINAPVPFTPGVIVKGEFLVPLQGCDFGIISDIDDTIIETNAISLLKMARNTFITNVRSRLAFEGVAAFYGALQKGKRNTPNNPIFYVSSSPWNLFDMLIEFMEINKVPHGPLMLRDYGLNEMGITGGNHMEHKYEQIQKILNTYPDLPFILIGDSGQDDPKIYQRIVKNFPGRILSVYIRDVKVPKKAQKVLEIAEDIYGHKVPMLLISDTIEASKHALEMGFIIPEKIAEIVKEKEMGEKGF